MTRALTGLEIAKQLKSKNPSDRRTYHYSYDHGGTYKEDSQDTTHNSQIQIAVWKVVPTDQETISSAARICNDTQQKSKSNTIKGPS